jgi:hypothetical protein
MTLMSGHSLQSTETHVAAAAAAPAVMVGPVLTLQPSKLDRLYWTRRNQDLIKIDRCVISLDVALTRYDDPHQPSIPLVCTHAAQVAYRSDRMQYVAVRRCYAFTTNPARNVASTFSFSNSPWHTLSPC